MNETIVNEVVEKAEEQLETAAENLDKAIANVANAPSQPLNVSKGSGLKNTLIAGGLVIGGGVAGYAIDHWVAPAIKKKWNEIKQNREKKKAEKKAKAEAKKAEKEQKPADAPAPATSNDADSPNEMKD